MFFVIKNKGVSHDLATVGLCYLFIASVFIFKIVCKNYFINSDLIHFYKAFKEILIYFYFKNLLFVTNVDYFNS